VRADKSKGIRRQVNIFVETEATREGFHSCRGGRLGLAFRTPNAFPLTPSDSGLLARRAPGSRFEEGKRRIFRDNQGGLHER
jgi:hypothetical protein